MSESADIRLKQIFSSTQENWGDEQTRQYIEGVFERFELIADEETLSHPIPAEFEVSGFFTRHEKHVICRELGSGQVGIVTVLHERMHQMERFREDASVVLHTTCSLDPNNLPQHHGGIATRIEPKLQFQIVICQPVPLQTDNSGAQGAAIMT